MIPTRDEALTLFLEYTETESLIKHGLCVEAVMKFFAKTFEEDALTWGIVGLLHDMDYEKFPDQHCVKVVEILREKNYDEMIIRAIISHCFGFTNDVEPLSKMEKTLYAIDELTGLITACVYMRPSKSVLDLEIKSLMKKYKTASFAAGVDRTVIERGCAMLDMELTEVMSITIEALRQSAETVGLKGNL